MDYTTKTGHSWNLNMMVSKSHLWPILRRLSFQVLAVRFWGILSFYLCGVVSKIEAMKELFSRFNWSHHVAQDCHTFRSTYMLKRTWLLEPLISIYEFNNLILELVGIDAESLKTIGRNHLQLGVHNPLSFQKAAAWSANAKNMAYTAAQQP